MLRGRDAAAERAVEMVNAVPAGGAGPERAAALVEVLLRWGEPADIGGASQDLAALGAVVESLRALLAIPDRDGAARAINGLLARYGGPPRLEQEGDWDWHLHADPVDADLASWFAASSALALAGLLVASAMLPWGVCRDPDCGRSYLDRGRRSPQRYCSATCATRARVQRHRAGQRDAAGPAR